VYTYTHDNDETTDLPEAMGVRRGIRGHAEEPVPVRFALPVRASHRPGRSRATARGATEPPAGAGLLPEDDESSLGTGVAHLVTPREGRPERVGPFSFRKFAERVDNYTPRV
jgi:hypothetical protein